MIFLKVTLHCLEQIDFKTRALRLSYHTQQHALSVNLNSDKSCLRGFGAASLYHNMSWLYQTACKYNS